MRRVVFLFKSAGSFLKKLIEPKQMITGLSVNGHMILNGWEDAPEESIIAEAYFSPEKQPARVALYCYHGPHQGEVFFLTERTELLGPTIDCTQIITPGEGEQGTYTIYSNGEVQLRAESGRFMRLNGIQENAGNLLDFDEVEILGNQFLVLDCAQSGALVQLKDTEAKMAKEPAWLN